MSNNRTWAVYMHISPSSKRYIGITSEKPVTKRWKNGFGYKKNTYFYRAITKYGWDSFEHIIIYEGLSEDEACNKEIELIRLYNSNIPEYGYNLTTGGQGCNGKKLSKEQIDFIIETNSIPVYQFDEDYNYIAEFSSAAEASRTVGVDTFNNSSIIQCCKLKYLTSYGYIWRYKHDVYDPYDKYCIPKYTKYAKNMKPVYQINIFTREYKRWDNITQAVNGNQLEYGYIHRCCNGKGNYHNNCIWKYCRDVQDIKKYILDDNNIFLGNYKYVWMCDINNNKLKLFKSYMQAGNEMGLDRKKISNACNSEDHYYAGYLWKHAKEK